MAGNLLTMTSQVQCFHGGFVLLITSNTHVFVAGAPVLLETDIHPVIGCPFTIGPKYSPCIRVEWTGGTTKMSIGGTPALVQSSIGKCINAEGAPQGIAIIASTQPKVSSL